MIIDDEPAMVDVICSICKELGHETLPFSSSERALEELPGAHPNLVIADMKMQRVGGLDILRACKSSGTGGPAVILVTAFASVETAVEAMKIGAFDYVTKPFKVDELKISIKRALDYQAAIHENTLLRREIRDRYKFENIVGTSAKMQKVFSLISKVANTDATVLILGESGTGKELVARALHYNSARHHRPFVAVNCSALPENLLESELFGHKKGSFTGAVQDKVGLFEEAHEGTIFLDEINSMAQPLQTKLLRVLQEREIRRVGDNNSITVNARVVAATNEPLLPKIRAGLFREDLYYRLAVIPIEMPSLRERMEDIPLLVNHFLLKHAKNTGGEPNRISPDALTLLQHYEYPGNVRELENAIERACALCEGGVIRVEDLPEHFPKSVTPQNPSDPATTDNEMPQVGIRLDEFVRQQEHRLIELTLKHNGGSREKTAAMLGISMATLYRKIEPRLKRLRSQTSVVSQQT